MKFNEKLMKLEGAERNKWWTQSCRAHYTLTLKNVWFRRHYEQQTHLPIQAGSE